VDQFLTLIEILAVNVMVAAPIVGIALFLTRGVDLEQGIPVRFAEPEWPHGVQEEDAPVWHVELAHPRGRSAPPVVERAFAPRVAQGCEVAPAP
jgi:hypothetical protein